MAATIVTDLKCYLNQLVEVQYLKGNLFSLDHAANTFNVYLYDDRGEPAYPGGEVLAQVVRSDGVTVDVTGAITENKAYVIFPQNVYAVPGPIVVTIKLIDNENVVTIACVIVNVRQSSTDDDDPGEISDTVAELISLINTARATLPPEYTALLSDIAATYASTSVYPVVGTKVWYNGELKKNKEPILTAETYDSTKWEDAVICSDIATDSARLSQVPDYVGAITGVIPLAFERGKFHSTPAVGSTVTKSNSLSYATAIIDVVEGDEITLNCTSGTGSNYRLYVWIDANGKSMNLVGTSLTGERTIVAPPGAAKLAINNRLVSQPTGYYAYKNHSIKARVDEITELIKAGQFTQGIDDYSIGGLTRTTNGDTLTLYGTSGYTRRYCCFNGQNIIRTTTQAFNKTLDPGTYYFEYARTGSATGRITISATYSTFGSGGFNVVSDTITKCIITFENPVMMGVLYYENEEYGTEEDPTTITVTIKKLSAIDFVARNENAETAKTVSNLVENEQYNAFDFLRPVGNFSSSTNSDGVDFTWDPITEKYHAVGTAGSLAYNVIFSNTSGLIPGVISGKDYYISCSSTDPGNLYVEVWLYYDGDTSSPVNNIFGTNGILTLPLNTTGMIVRIRAKKNSVVDGYIGKIAFKNALTNEELSLLVSDLFSASGVSF